MSRAWSRVVLAYAMRVVLCALKAIPAMQMRAITSNRRLDCTEAGNRATSSRTKTRTHKSLSSPVRAILISATPFDSSHMAVLHGLRWQQRWKQAYSFIFPAYSVLGCEHTQAVRRPPPTCLCSGHSQVQSRPSPSTRRTPTYAYPWPPLPSSPAAQGSSLFSPRSEGPSNFWVAPHLQA